MALTTIGYFLGWLLGFLAALITLSFAKEVLVLGLSFFLANKVVNWYQERNKVVEVEATEIPMDAKLAS
jgi:hypothetical protein